MIDLSRRLNLFQGDCLEIMKDIPDKSIDLILTDPPYGIGIANKECVGGGSWRGKTKKFDIKEWDNNKINKNYFDEIFRISKNQIVFGGNYYSDWFSSSSCWLVWYKRDGLPTRTFADCELAWTSFNEPSRVFNFKQDGFIRDAKEKYTHPTQKPIALMEWCLNKYSKFNDLVLDCFMGSGTTGVASLKLNRRFIGVELDEKYFGIAKERIGSWKGQERLL